MSKWLKKFLGNMPESRTDNTDRFTQKPNMSVLSVPPEGLLDQNPANMSVPHTDSTDRFNSETNMSVLSVPPEGLLDQNLENMSESRTDSTDRFSSETNMSGLSDSSNDLSDRIVSYPFDGEYFLYHFEERLAIAEIDGQQSPTQAQRIAYQDAFIAVLNTLPYEEEQGYYDEDWLTRRIKAAQNWLVAQGLQQPE
jgi:hypothetical protein